MNRNVSHKAARFVTHVIHSANFKIAQCRRNLKHEQHSALGFATHSEFEDLRFDRTSLRREVAHV